VVLSDTQNPYSDWPYYDEWYFFASARDIDDYDQWHNQEQIPEGGFTSGWSDVIENRRVYFAVASLDFLAKLYIGTVTIEYEYGG
jgi:hypothetical protein